MISKRSVTLVPPVAARRCGSTPGGPNPWKRAPSRRRPNGAKVEARRRDFGRTNLPASPATRSPFGRTKPIGHDAVRQSGRTKPKTSGIRMQPQIDRVHEPGTREIGKAHVFTPTPFTDL